MPHYSIPKTRGNGGRNKINCENVGLNLGANIALTNDVNAQCQWRGLEEEGKRGAGVLSGRENHNE